MRSREERSQFFDTNIGPETGLLSEESDMFINDGSYDKVYTIFSLNIWADKPERMA